MAPVAFRRCAAKPPPEAHLTTSVHSREAGNSSRLRVPEINEVD